MLKFKRTRKTNWRNGLLCIHKHLELDGLQLLIINNDIKFATDCRQSQS